MFSTKRKITQRERAMQYAAKHKVEANLPEFKSLLWKLYRTAHPDLVRPVSSEKADINDTSMQKLNGILSTIKCYNEYPAAIISEIPFYLKSSDNEFQRIDLKIKTAGGDCRHQLAASFEQFFSKAGIHNGMFTWGTEYFPTSGAENPK
eukprot:gene4440-8849_t